MSISRATLLSLLLAASALPVAAHAVAVSGHVTAAGTGVPLAGASVSVYETFPDAPFSASTNTDADGYYELQVPQGFPHFTAAAAGRVPGSSTPTLDSDPKTVDFSLALAASISGTVRDAATQAMLADKTVTLLNADTAALVQTTTTGAQGTFAFPLLAPGNYAACIGDAADAYLDTCYDAIPLAADGTQAFTTIVLAEGQDAQSIDFALSAGASINGVLRDGYDASLLADADLVFDVYSEQKQLLFATPVHTDSAGAYAIRGLPAGNYYVSAGQAFDGRSTNSLYLFRFYGCAAIACALADALPVSVAAADAQAIDIAPFPGSVVIGTVTDAAGNSGIAGVTVQACENYYFFFSGITGSAVTDAGGNYVLKHLIGSANSALHVATVDAAAYLNVIWPDTATLPASFCHGATGGTVIGGFTTPDQAVGPIDFSLHQGASISGNLVAQEFPDAALPGRVSLYFDDGQSRQLVATVETDTAGHYQTVGVAPGTYYVVAYFESGIAGCTLYGDVPCDGPGALNDPAYIDFASATPVVLDAQETKAGIDVHLPVRIFSGNFQ